MGDIGAVGGEGASLWGEDGAPEFATKPDGGKENDEQSTTCNTHYLLLQPKLNRYLHPLHHHLILLLLLLLNLLSQAIPLSCGN